MTITTAKFGRALFPGINKWYGAAYDEWNTEYPEIFDTYPASLRTEKDVLFSGFGLLPKKAEAAPITYDDAEEAFDTDYTQATYSLGFIISRELIEDELYGVMEKRARALGFSVRQTKEILAAYVLNQAFNGAVTYGDGSQLVATGRANWSGGTWANRLAADADLSETAVENMVNLINDFRDDRGLRIAAMPEKLIIPTELQWDAERILMSTHQNNTENNAVNALYTKGTFPGGYVVNHYLTDADAWFIKTNVQDGFKEFVKREDTFEEDNDFDTESLKYKASFRTVFGVTDPRCVAGSGGA